MSERSSGGTVQPGWRGEIIPGDTECYHYDCSNVATRIHHDKVRSSPPTPCCDEHEPMYATKMWTPIEEQQSTLGGVGQ